MSAVPQAEPDIDMGTLFERLKFEPHSLEQAEYCTSTKRFNIPCCGRRWGKSQAAGHRMTYKMFIPDTYNWIIGPTYVLGEKEFRVVYHDFRKLGMLKYCKKAYAVKQGDMRIETPWGSHLQVASAEREDSLLGEGLSHAIMSEAARHERSTWEQFIEPALSDLLGTCDFPSTPKGFNWYHGLWQLGQVENKNYKSWRFPSWMNLVRYPGGFKNEEIQRIKSVASKQYFDQEYAALFTAVTGKIFEEWDESIHVKPHTYRRDWENYQAFDYGFNNPFVCLDIQVGPDDTVYVWREYYARWRATYEHGIILKDRDNPEGFHIDGMWGDPRGADEAATLALVYGYVANHDIPWKHGIEAIKRLLKPQNGGFPHMYVDPSCVNLIRQMGQLHVKEQIRAKQDLNEMQGDGNIQHKRDDHAVDAFRYFVGPHYVAGMNEHLDDLNGQEYLGSESEDFFTLHNNVTLTGSPFGSDLVKLG